MPRQAAIAIASAITGDRVAMTNHPWSFSISALRQHFGFERLEVINDFTAQALALPRLGPADRIAVGGGTAVPGTPLAVLGPGSGLGVSGLVPNGARWLALTGEGGHATMAAANDRESAVLGYLRHRLDHVSAERVLSGPGLVNLYNTLTVIDRGPVKGLRRGPDNRSRHARRGSGLRRGDCDVLRHAGHRRRKPGINIGCARRGFYSGRDRAAAWSIFCRFAVSRALSAKGSFESLSRGDSDLRRDTPARRVSRLCRPAGGLKSTKMPRTGIAISLIRA